MIVAGRMRGLAGVMCWMLVAMLVLSRGICVGQELTADERAEIIEEATVLAGHYLDQVNAVDGIQYIGGPFHIDEHNSSIAGCNETVDDPNDLEVTFTYANPHGIRTAPGKFSIQLDIAPEPEKKSDRKLAPEVESIVIEGGLVEQEVQQIKDMLRRKRWLWQCPYRHHCAGEPEGDVVSIGIDGQLQRHRQSRLGIDVIRQIRPGYVLVVVRKATWSFSSWKYESRMTHIRWADNLEQDLRFDVFDEGQALLFKRSDLSKPFMLIDYDRQILVDDFQFKSVPDVAKVEFEADGQLTDEELLSMVRETQRIEAFKGDISSIRVEDQSVTAWSRPRLPERPGQLVVLKLDGDDWRICRVHTFWISHYLDISTGSMFSLLPLLPVPSEADIAAMVTAFKERDAGLDYSDLRAIAMIVLRLRKVDTDVLSVQWESDEIKISPGYIKGPLWGRGNTVKLRKIDGQWIIIGVSSWVS